MFGLFFLPFYLLGGVLRGATRLAGSGGGYRRVPRYRHPYCTVRHLSDDTRVRCETTANYRRARAEGIAAENAQWASDRADEAEYTAWAANHPIRSHLSDWFFGIVLGLGLITLLVCWLYMTHH